MRISCKNFVRLPKFLMSLLSSNHPTPSDTCLITMKDCTELTHVARASDGRVYDAFALHTYLKYYNTHVIPGVTITHVDIVPMTVYVVGVCKNVGAKVRKYLDKVKKATVERREKRVSSHMLIRILNVFHKNNYRHIHAHSIKRIGTFRHSPDSPFMSLNDCKKKLGNKCQTA